MDRTEQRGKLPVTAVTGPAIQVTNMQGSFEHTIQTLFEVLAHRFQISLLWADDAHGENAPASLVGRRSSNSYRGRLYLARGRGVCLCGQIVS